MNNQWPRSRTFFAALLGMFVLHCGGSSPPPVVSHASPASATSTTPSRGPLAKDAVAGVSNKALAELLDEHFEWELRQSPTRATRLGDHRFDSELGHVDRDAITARRARERSFRDRARAIDIGTLSPDDRTTLTLFLEDVEGNIGVDVCDSETWTLSSFNNAVSTMNQLPEDHLVSTVDDGKHLVARYGEIERFVAEETDNLRRGLREGRVASRQSVSRLLTQLERQLNRPAREWSLSTKLASSEAKARRKGFSPAEEAAFLDDAVRVVETRVAPAFRAFRDFVAKEILPAARPDDREGVSALPNGAACYRARIVKHLASAREPEELHRTGLAEIERINGEMRILGKKLFGTDDLTAILQRLRTDKSLYFDTPQSVQDAATKALDKARKAVPTVFGILPKADCIVSPIPEESAPFTTIAYYNQPNYDGSKPGQYFINTYRAETRPRFEMEALTFHESIPGHHLQIAMAQERPALPAFRKFSFATVFIEGWALYTEKLADEMGLYSGDIDRMGMLSYDAWRASRLVVDTGIHHLGWTRAKAEQYMREHTALTTSNIENEVDRYIAWPGQALAYKVGQMEILRLRANARETLGSKFDLKGFHDAVLSSGPVSLPLLRKQVEAWVDTRRGTAP